MKRIVSAAAAFLIGGMAFGEERCSIKPSSSVMGGDNPARGPRNVVIARTRLLNSATGIEAWNVSGASRITGNIIQADQATEGNAFHVRPLNQTFFSAAST